ncbi:MAG: response regulator transcription factor [Acidimicrobiales bacterium]
MSVTRVLVVEDEPVIAAEVEHALSAHGYDVTVAATGREALAAAAAQPPDLVVLDLGLPDLDGVHVCRLLRADLPTVPIVIATARDDDVDIVVGLDAGATDYVVKPFSMAVLLARLRAHLRRPVDDGPSGTLVVGALRFDVEAHRAFLDATELELRPKEFALLQVLVERAGRVVTRDHLLSEVWDLQWESSTKTLDMHVHALRRKLGDRADGQPWISTVRTVGYRFELA